MKKMVINFVYLCHVKTQRKVVSLFGIFCVIYLPTFWETDKVKAFV